MNAAKTLKIGDLLFFQFGAMCGEDWGTVVGFEPTQFGTNAWVRRSDFTMTTVEQLAGTCSVKHGVDYEGTPYMSARDLSNGRIGAYLVTKGV